MQQFDMRAINIDTIVAAVGCHVQAIATVPLGQGDIADGGAATQQQEQQEDDFDSDNRDQELSQQT